MAFIENQDEELNPQQGQQPLVGQGSTQVSSGGNMAGVGAGGSGGWTNLQAYLKANDNDTGSANALSSTVGDQFNKERDTMNSDSQKFLSDAQNKASQNNLSNDQADKAVKDAGSAYNWNPTNSAYTDSVNQMKNRLSGSYSGPRDYSYGLSADTQNLGQEVGQGGAFDTLMNGIYSKNAGRPLSSGQFQLQKQLDTSNEKLADQRQKLSGQYQQLGADRDKIVGDTTAGLGGVADQYAQSQNKMKDYLSGKLNTTNQNISKSEGDARNSFQNDFAATPTDARYFNGSGMGNMRNLQNYVDNSGAYRDWRGGDQDINNHFGQAFRTYQPALDNFYGQENQKYGGTADEDKRQSNALMDFLDMSGDRKQQGFTVK